MADGAPMHPAKFRFLGAIWSLIALAFFGLLLPTTREGTWNTLTWIAGDILTMEDQGTGTAGSGAQLDAIPEDNDEGDPSDSLTFDNGYTGDAQLQHEPLPEAGNFTPPTTATPGLAPLVIAASTPSTPSTTEPAAPTTATPTTAPPTTASQPTYTIVPCPHVLAPNCDRSG